MRILHVITRMILGGAQENTLLTCEGLHARGHAVCLATGPALGPEGELMARARRGGYYVVELPGMVREIDPLAELRAVSELDRLIGSWRPEVIHTHSSKAGIIGRLVGHWRGVPVVVHTLHGVAFGPTARWWENAVYVPLERWAAGVSHGLVSVADAMTAQALAVGVGRAEQYVTIRSGMEVEPLLSARAVWRDHVREQLAAGPHDLLVGKVSRLAPRKGFEDVLAAAERLASKCPHVRFVLVGDGPLGPSLRAEVAARGLASRVTFTGLVEGGRIAGLMAAFDVLLHASRREGLPRVVPQALLAGTPVVCTNIDGAPEVIEPGVTGLLYSPGDIATLVAELECLLGDAALRSRLADEGRRRCRAMFSAELMVERIETLYRELLNRVGR